MYLDTHEKEQVGSALMSFNWIWTVQRIEYIKHAELSYLVLSLTFLMLIAGVMALGIQRALVALGVYGVLLAFALPIHLKMKRNLRRLREGSLEKWINEVEQIEVRSDERQNFLRLIEMMKTGTKEEVLDALSVVMQSSSLACLSFVRELSEHFQNHE